MPPAVTKAHATESCVFLELEEQRGTYLFVRPARPNEHNLCGRVAYILKEADPHNGIPGHCQCTGFAIRRTCRHLDLLKRAIREGEPRDKFVKEQAKLAEGATRADDLISSLFD